MDENCSKLKIKTPEPHRWSRFGIFIINSEQISDIALLFPLLTLNKALRQDIALLFPLRRKHLTLINQVFLFQALNRYLSA